jgi:hypothetical protein
MAASDNLQTEFIRAVDLLFKLYDEAMEFANLKFLVF